MMNLKHIFDGLLNNGNMQDMRELQSLHSHYLNINPQISEAIEHIMEAIPLKTYYRCPDCKHTLTPPESHPHDSIQCPSCHAVTSDMFYIKLYGVNCECACG